MNYPEIKFLHICCAAVSYALFLLRGIWMMRASEMLQRRWVRTLPHAIDTLLLTSAIALTLTIHQYPLVDNWLSAKVLALLFYIGLGSVALKYGKSLKIRIAAWLTAQAVFAFIVFIALNH